MKILFIGDIVGDAGKQAVKELVPALRTSLKLDFVVANGENVAGGLGVTPKTANELLASSIDVITSGNHIYHHKEILSYLEKNSRLLRPLNYLKSAPGKGVWKGEVYSGVKVAVLNVIGQVHMGPADNPFSRIDEELEHLRGEADIIVVDMHAEANGEKVAMGYYLDGRVSMVLGTHTHVATADERILPQGTAYITDVGMTGPYDSVIGMKREVVLKKYATGVSQRYEPATGDIHLAGVVVDVEESTGKARSIERVQEKI